MTNDRILELLEIERECVTQQSKGGCDHDCEHCHLAQSDSEILEMYDDLIYVWQDLMNRSELL